MENLKQEILELRKQKKAASGDIEKALKKEILRKRTLLENMTLRSVEEDCKLIYKNRISSLTDKQKDFFEIIHTELNFWINSHIKGYLNLDRIDRKLPSKEEIKITIKRIGELLTAEYNKKTFSNLVDEFNFIKNGGRFSGDGKYSRLRKDI